MIVNVWTVVSLFLDLVTAALAAVAGAVALRGLRRLVLPDELEDRLHLLAMLVGVLAVVRLIAWPHFYLLLRSYVPDLAPFGVMCVFGVTRIQPSLVLVIQVVKPVLLGLLGLWWLTELVDRDCARPVLATTRLRLTVLVAGIAAADSITGMVYLFATKVGRPVTCCTRFLDTAAATLPTDAAGLHPVGDLPASVTLLLYLALASTCVAVAFLLSRRRPADGRVSPTLLAGGLGVSGLLLLMLTRQAWLDSVAPTVLQLPYHHCVYEVITDIPMLGLAAMLAIGSSIGLLWPIALEAWRHRAPVVIGSLQQRVYSLVAMALASSLLIVLVHIA